MINSTDARTGPAVGPSIPPSIQVVGVGLEGPDSLTTAARDAIEDAELLIGTPRLLAAFPNCGEAQWPLGDLQTLLTRLQAQLERPHCPNITLLTSGDPLFFGLGRLLLSALPAERLTFHPSVSAVQLAFSRLRIPWQQATIVSLHGRSSDPFNAALAQGKPTIAVIGDPQVSPAAISAMVATAPCSFHLWCCENLGSSEERVQRYELGSLPASVAPLHVWVLQKCQTDAPPSPPILGVADQQFARFDDRPGLMTIRPVRVLALAELDLRPHQTVWDIGAGTGSVSVEIARLSPTSRIYAVEKSAAGLKLIQANIARFETPQVIPVGGAAPGALTPLPNPHRVFIGGHGGDLATLLDAVTLRLHPQGRVVVATATLESQTQLMTWLQSRTQSSPTWSHTHLQVNVSCDSPVGRYQRLSPLNPVLLTALMPGETLLGG